MATTSTKKPARATTKKPKKKSSPNTIRAQAGNPCNDQNGMILCWGGMQTSFPFPASGGPYMLTVAYNAQTGLMELQYADLTTLCPGNLVQVAAAPCEPCGDPTPSLLDSPDAKDILEQPNS